MSSLNIEYLFYTVYHFLVDQEWRSWVAGGWFNLRLISFILTVFFLAWVIHLGRQIVALRQAEAAELKRLLELELARTPKRNQAWERVLQYQRSENPNDWKQAIIAADTMLDELVKSMQYPGETLGERLKQVEQSDFKTLDRAWEAHKVRNLIAHEGGYELTERVARETLANYRAVFEEFHVI